MRWIHRTAAAGLLGAAAAAGLAAAQVPQDPGPAEKAGEKLDEAGRSIKKGLRGAGDKIRGQFARARESVHAMGIESRVYGRLHWDKLLADAPLDLDIKDGVATLRGTVDSAKAKLRHVELAKETVGVTQVIDELAVQAPPRTAPATLSDPSTKS